MSGREDCYDNSMVLRRENIPQDCFLILLTTFKTIKSAAIRVATIGRVFIARR